MCLAFPCLYLPFNGHENHSPDKTKVAPTLIASGSAGSKVTMAK